MLVLIWISLIKTGECFFPFTEVQLSSLCICAARPALFSHILTTSLNTSGRYIYLPIKEWPKPCIKHNYSVTRSFNRQYVQRLDRSMARSFSGSIIQWLDHSIARSLDDYMVQLLIVLIGRSLNGWIDRLLDRPMIRSSRGSPVQKYHSQIFR